MNNLCQLVYRQFSLLTNLCNSVNKGSNVFFTCDCHTGGCCLDPFDACSLNRKIRCKRLNLFLQHGICLLENTNGFMRLFLLQCKLLLKIGLVQQECRKFILELFNVTTAYGTAISTSLSSSKVFHGFFLFFYLLHEILLRFLLLLVQVLELVDQDQLLLSSSIRDFDNLFLECLDNLVIGSSDHLHLAVLDGQGMLKLFLGFFEFRIIIIIIIILRLFILLRLYQELHVLVDFRKSFFRGIFFAATSVILQPQIVDLMLSFDFHFDHLLSHVGHLRILFVDFLFEFHYPIQFGTQEIVY
mmetsp:Transcript_18466/g.45769  ORF Transcript_18466/g.45769 Transcript_18466/m.45769 type:complete len:300 (-) Transcript_18466:480-1379(-)